MLSALVHSALALASPTAFRAPLGDLQVTNADARWTLEQYQSVPVTGVTDKPIQTTFCRAVRPLDSIPRPLGRNYLVPAILCVR